MGFEAADGASDLLGDARYMSTSGLIALAAFTAALAVSRLGAEASAESAYRTERAWQSAWIANELLSRRGS